MSRRTKTDRSTSLEQGKCFWHLLVNTLWQLIVIDVCYPNLKTGCCHLWNTVCSLSWIIFVLFLYFQNFQFKSSWVIQDSLTCSETQLLYFRSLSWLYDPIVSIPVLLISEQYVWTNINGDKKFRWKTFVVLILCCA